MDRYELALLVAGIAALGAAVLPRALRERPLSLPVVYVALGAILFSLPLDFPVPDPIEHGGAAERLTELVVIISLMGAGLRLDRPVGWHRWSTTWRLLAITMPLTIAGVALLGYGMLGLALPSAILLGAVLAPTDPVLASDVQVGPPGEPDEDEVRFGLTSEAGLNDALAFPFTYLALALLADGPRWFAGWVAIDVVWRLAAAFLVGVVVGRLLGRLLFHPSWGGRLVESAGGFVALAATLVAYGLAELAHGYGFLAVFVAAVALRSYERDHEYHAVMHDFAEQIERLLMVLLLVLFGGALTGGLLGELDWRVIALSVVVLLVLRPLAGALALVGGRATVRERWALAFLGVRGVGSLYYLAFALQHGDFAGGRQLWSVVAFTVLLSVVGHGLTATPTMAVLDRARRARGRRVDARRAARDRPADQAA